MNQKLSLRMYVGTQDALNRFDVKKKKEGLLGPKGTFFLDCIFG